MRIIETAKNTIKMVRLYHKKRTPSTCEKAKCARVHKEFRDMVMKDPIYEKMRKYWRQMNENNA